MESEESYSDTDDEMPSIHGDIQELSETVDDEDTTVPGDAAKAEPQVKGREVQNKLVNNYTTDEISVDHGITGTHLDDMQQQTQRFILQQEPMVSITCNIMEICMPMSIEHL